MTASGMQHLASTVAEMGLDAKHEATGAVCNTVERDEGGASALFIL